MLLSIPTSLWAQGFIEKVTDLLEVNIGPPPVNSEGFQAKAVFSPVAYYEPNTSLGLGFGAKFLFKPKGAGLETRTSNIPVAFSYTLNNQLFLSSGYTIFFPKEQWLVRGNLDYKDFPQSYYGIGNRTNEDDRLEIGYQQLLVEPLLLRRVGDKELFIGGGFRYNRFYNTELEAAVGELPAGISLQDSLGSTSVGVELAVTFDDRDNVLNARRGVFAEFTQGFYGRALGGTNAFQLSKLDLRQYEALGPRQLVATNFFARYAWNDAPVQELSSLGGPTLLRGFLEGRFRDRLALFLQAEYRWQTWKRAGFVLFAGTGQVAPTASELTLSDLRYSVGTGVRILIVPSENLNLRMDYAFGFGRSTDSGFYLGISEAF
ncbi:MAG: BamA/TamA family outer membrane protein [Bacteroidota bacterium]